MKNHRLDAAPETVHWGFFDANLKPLITVDPGDEVVISTVSGPASTLPPAGSGMTVPDALHAIHENVTPKFNGPHIMTGPVAVRGAKAGQVLEVRIKTDRSPLQLGLQRHSSARAARCPTISSTRG